MQTAPPSSGSGSRRKQGEAVCLSTCNRTEVYLATEEPREGDRLATELLAEVAGVERRELEPYLYRLDQDAAAVHLFRVAAGLDSLVPGEGEILGQVRTAYERGSVGPMLDRLFSHALHTGKKVRTDTAIAQSPGTTSSAAAALAAQVFGDLDGSSIAIVGAGKIGTLAAHRLIKRGAKLQFVANRTDERGRALADELGGTTIPLEQLAEAVASADILVSSTSSPDLVLTKADVAEVLPVRKGRPLLLIDLAVPRDLDPAINELGDCYLYDIDDLEAVVQETLRGREVGVRESRGDRSRRRREVQRLARDPRGRARDRVVARAGGGDPPRRARQGVAVAVGALGAGAARSRVAHHADGQQAPARADPAAQGGRRRGASWS